MGMMLPEDVVRDAYRLGEIAQRLGVCVRTVKRWVQSGELPRPVVIGSERFILVDDWKEYLERRKVKQ